MSSRTSPGLLYDLSNRSMNDRISGLWAFVKMSNEIIVFSATDFVSCVLARTVISFLAFRQLLGFLCHFYEIA